MKNIEDMTLEELKEEKERVLKTLSVVGTSYTMERVLKIIKKINEQKEK